MHASHRPIRLLVAVPALVFLCAFGHGATLVVNVGAYPSAQAAAHDEENVTWQDADPADDTLCTEAFAAVELQDYLRKISGNAEGFPIVDDDAVDTASGDLLVVGGPTSNAAARRFTPALGLNEVDLTALGPEGYVIRSRQLEGRRVTLIAGGGRVGTLYGAYDLLHRLSVRWYAPGEVNEEAPLREWTGLPEINVRETPAFLTRGFHAWEDRGDPDFLLWMARNRLNYWCVQQSEKALMHKLGIMMIGGGHILTDYYLSPRATYPYNHVQFEGDEDKPTDPYPVSPEFLGDANADGRLSYFEAHPEWYALRDGKRSDRIHGDGGDNFCTSNPDAMAELMRNAVEDLATGRYKDAGLMNAWMLDAGKWCECESCRAQGIPTDRNLLFVYAYDRAIKQAQAEGRINRPVRLLFLAYADVLAPPTRPLPTDFDYETCIATYFPIVRCYVHHFDDPDCAPNARYNRHLQGWATDPARHYRGQLCIGEYYNVSGYKSLPVCFMDSMCADIPYYYAQGARHFHYMHCTSGNWGNKALTNWQMARQLWDPHQDCGELWNDYFAGRYGPAYQDMRRFYESLEQMLCNVSELKYGLARRLDTGAANLFPGAHLRYDPVEGEAVQGPTLQEILGHARRCREIIDAVQAQALPPRIAHRVAETERLFTYGERTVLFYEALAMSYMLAREDRLDDARMVFGRALSLADLLRADTVSTTLASSHANAGDALQASYAVGALGILNRLLGPLEPDQVKALDAAAQPLVFTGREFQGGGALRFGYGLHAYPGRIPVSEVGNYLYGQGTPYDRVYTWFRLETALAGDLYLKLVGLKCPQPMGGEVHARILVNDALVFDGHVPFPEDRLGEMEVVIPAAALRPGINTLELRNVQPGGTVGQRPWFGVDRVELRDHAATPTPLRLP